jgi:hypothetical protein
MACEVKYQGQTLSFEEFAEKLHNGLLDEFIAQGVVKNVPTIKSIQDAVQKQSAEGVLSRQQGEAGKAGGERQGMGQGKQGQEAAKPSKEEITSAEATVALDEETELLLEGLAAERRRAGKYTVDGVTYTRNEKGQGIVSEEGGDVRFTNEPGGGGVVVPFRYKLVEANTVQPSHEGGLRNPNFFIPEAQPKNRNDQASLLAEDDFANNPRFGELGQDTGAYKGAPVVNERGEVIQGNNRAAGLKKGYAVGNKKYKQDLAANAEKFGFTKEQVESMENPVLVREVIVTDEKAIELGNYDVKDLETAGKRRIDPSALVRRLPSKVKASLAKVISAGETIKESIKENADEIYQLIRPYINTSIANTIITNGKLNSVGIEDVEGLFTQFLFQNGDPNLPQMFEGLSNTQREGIKKSLPYLLSAGAGKSIIPDVQEAIIAISDFMASGSSDFNAWLSQGDIFVDNKTPKDIYSPLALKIAEILNTAKTQADIVGTTTRSKTEPTSFVKYSELTKGTEAGLFEEAKEGISKKEAIKQAFNVDYNERKTYSNSQRIEEKAYRKQEEENSVKQKYKDDLAKGLDNLITKLGGKKNITPEERTFIIEDLRNIIKGLVGLTYEEIKEMVVPALKKLGLTSREVDDILVEATTEERRRPDYSEPSLERETETKKSRTLETVETFSSKRIAERIKKLENYYYKVLPNEEVKAAVNKIFELYSVEEIADDFLNPDVNSKMYGPVKTVIGLELMKRFSKEKNYEMFNKVANEYAEIAKEGARTIQIINIFDIVKSMGGIFAKLKAKEIIQERNQRLRDLNKQKMEQIAMQLKNANTQAIDEALGDEKIREIVGKILQKYAPQTTTTDEKQKEASKAKSKTNLNEGRIKELIDKKKLLKEKIKKGGYFTSGGITPELFELAATNIELGTRTFAEFSKQMTKDVGKAIKPYLLELYKEGKSILKNQGQDVSDTTSNVDASSEFSSMFEDKDIKTLVGKTIQENLETILRKGLGESQRSKTIKEITDKLGLEPSDAASIVDKINSEFDKRVKNKQEGIKKKLLKGLNKQTRERKESWEKLAEASRSGILSDEELKPYLEKAFGIEELSEKDANEIERIADNITKFPEGSPFQTREIYRLAQKLNSLSPFTFSEIMTSIFYGNILSGPKTQEGNFVSNLSKAIELLSIDTIRAISKGDYRFLGTALKGLLIGLQGEGIPGFKSALLTGKIPTREKIKGFRGIEDWNPTSLVGKGYKQLKYVTRLMGGVDALYYESAKYKRAFQLAYDKAKRDNKGMTSSEAYQKFINEIYNNDPTLKNFIAQADADYNERVSQINDDLDLTDEQRKSQIMEAGIDRDSQVYYYIFGNLPEDIQEESKIYAKRATYTQTPEGFIGLLARNLNSFIQGVPLMNRVIPFVNIIGNVANDAFNYGNFGLAPIARSVTEKGSISEAINRNLERFGIVTTNKYKFNEKSPLTENEKADLRAKAVLAFSLSAASMLYLLRPKDDDDEDYETEVSGAGPSTRKERDELLAKGWRPYSIRIGNNYVSYKYTPFVLLFAIVGNIQDQTRYKSSDDELELKVTNALFKTYSRTFFDMTFLTGLADLFSAIANKNDKGVWQQDLGKWVSKNLKAAVVPFSNFIEQSYNYYLDYMDMPMPETRRSEGEKTFTANLLSGIPIISNMYNMPRMNALGEPIMVENEFLITEKKESKGIWKLFEDKKYRPTYPYPNEIAVIDEDGIKNISSKEYSTFMKVRGNFIKSVINHRENKSKLEGYPIKDGKKEPFKKEINEVFYNGNKFATHFILLQRRGEKLDEENIEKIIPNYMKKIKAYKQPKEESKKIDYVIKGY